MFPLRQTRPCLALPPGSAHPSSSSSGNFQTFQHSNLSTFRQGVHSSLATAPLTPFPATLTGESQLIENPAALSPVLATLTRHVHHNPFVCHSYKKHPGARIPSECHPERGEGSSFSRSLAPLPRQSHPSKGNPAIVAALSLPLVTSHQSPGTASVLSLTPVTSHQSRITNSFIIRTSIKPAHKLFRMNTSKTQHLKPFRMNTYKKTGEGGRAAGVIPCLKLRSRPAAVVGDGGDSQPAKFVGIILAVEDVPLLAILKNFFFLRGDFLADFEIRLFFFVKSSRQDLHDLLADGVAVFHEFHVVAGNQHVRDLMGNSYNFFAAQSHSYRLPSSFPFPGVCQKERRAINLDSEQQRFAAPLLRLHFAKTVACLPQNQFAITRELLLDLLVHLLVRDAGTAHFLLMLDQYVAHFFVQAVLDGDLFHHALPDALRHRFRRLRLNQLPFHQPLDHFRGHVPDVVPCDQHLRVSPLRVSKRKSLLAGETKCKELYSSSRLVTLCLSSVVFPAGDEFQWGEVGERLVRADAVVGVFPMA